MAVKRWNLWNAPSGAVDAAQRLQFLVGYPFEAVEEISSGRSTTVLVPRSGKRGIRGTQWETCDRCGIDYPITQIVLQRGLKVCVRKCFDDPAKFDEVRQKIIGDILSQDTEEGVDTRYDYINAMMANQGEENNW